MKRGKPLRRTGRLRPRSKKTAKVYCEQRVPLVKAVLTEHPICEVPWCTEPSTDPHEVLRRSQGGSITDRANVRAVCNPHNELFAGLAPQWAYDLGFVRKRWQEEA